MMGQVEQAASFYEFSLERHVPTDHLLRSIARFVELSEVRRELTPFYSSTGRPSIDPELMIRMLIVGCCFGRRGMKRHAESTQYFDNRREARIAIARKGLIETFVIHARFVRSVIPFARATMPRAWARSVGSPQRPRRKSTRSPGLSEEAADNDPWTGGIESDPDFEILLLLRRECLECDLGIFGNDR